MRHDAEYTRVKALYSQNKCQLRQRKLDLTIYWYKWSVLLVASLAILAFFDRYIY